MTRTYDVGFFEYRWRHVPSGMTGTRRLPKDDPELCHMGGRLQEAFLRLVNKWTNQQPGVWVYEAAS